jgi:hypothetical protein
MGCQDFLLLLGLEIMNNMAKLLIDLTGRRFGKLLVTHEGERRGKHRTWWCQCGCGKKRLVYHTNLAQGYSKTCGCGNIKDLTGMRLGSLIPIKYRIEKGNRVRWLCKCDCGREKWIFGWMIISGHSKSCGCEIMIHSRMKSYEKGKYQRKEYTLPNGRVVSVQGYEPSTLDFLIKSGVSEIKLGVEEMPTIFYNWKNKKRRYYPDCIADEVLVETKSIYTWKYELDRNQSKLKSTVMDGFDVRLFIWKNKDELLIDVFFPKNVEPIFPILP